LKNNIIIKYILILVFLVGCATNEDKSFERVNVEKYYRPSGMIKYFLPEVPRWKNTSHEGNCLRSGNVQSLHIENVMGSFGISYEDALQMQYLYNLNYRDAVAKKKGTPSLKEEEGLFFEALDKIKAGQKVFKKPVFRQVNLVWVDGLLGNGGNKLKSLMNKESFMQGRPLLVSMCLNRTELVNKLRNLRIPFEGSRFISYEMFTYFTKTGDRGAREILDLTQFLSSKQRISFYYRGKKPNNILGKFKYIKIK